MFFTRPAAPRWAYYVEGLATPDAAASRIVGTYGGSAWGTYFSGSGGVDMTGTFSCNINVPNKSVSHFQKQVQDPTQAFSASIANGAGSFTGTSGEFKVAGGTFQLNGGEAVYKACTGSLYGPAGEYVGGAWAMDRFDNNNAAVGIFVGGKGASPAPPPAMPPPLPPVAPPGQQRAL